MSDAQTRPAPEDNLTFERQPNGDIRFVVSGAGKPGATINLQPEAQQGLARALGCLLPEEAAQLRADRDKYYEHFLDGVRIGTRLEDKRDALAARLKVAERMNKMIETECETLMAHTSTPIRRAKEDGHLSEMCHQEGRWHGINDVLEKVIELRAALTPPPSEVGT